MGQWRLEPGLAVLYHLMYFRLTKGERLSRRGRESSSTLPTSEPF